MLQLNHIKKEYKTGDLVQKALDDVSLNLRDNEFVAILGPSGSGKTTLLNVIGGLDRYDSGDLIINGISTKKYTDRDWDSYRNHTIGFVFQSYNLIPHQTVLSNVELALTISGISGAERRSRAAKALEQVGLGDQLHKHPSEMSGGQMQRVAIARALVNNPDILLADEPTGALDSDTSIQVMELLKEVAKDRLVVMVTHNPELAEQYATRIVRLRDGVIQSDTAPFAPDDSAQVPPVHKNLGRSSMSPLTALALSFNNLLTKKDPHPAHRICGFHRHHRHCAHPFALGRCEQLYPGDGTLHPFGISAADLNHRRRPCRPAGPGKLHQRRCQQHQCGRHQRFFHPPGGHGHSARTAEPADRG